ncbi:phage tail tape measure protein [Mycobacterium hodleri]|uniref:phage tail tape measure protein n=1 Tax=Mycolicibacterium hodleri TaxID=49897 RepID=UPI0021F30D3C|nr:phage tail tape measure protein [Mycolicibacterium hodleri]MCV7134413.1 phage tail tape measure protein [Mycolicibacterium hodleri]
MSGAIELAQVWVPLMPEASKLSGGVDRIGRDATRVFGRATKTMGAQMASGIDAAGKKAVASLRDVEKQTSKVAVANAKNADALGRVKVAQAASDDLAKKAIVTDKQRVQAAENLAKAERAQVITAKALTAEKRNLRAVNAAAKDSDAVPMPKIPWGARLRAMAEDEGRQTGSRFNSGFASAMKTGGALVAAGGFVASIKEVVGTGLDYDKALNEMQGVTNATGQQMAAVSAKARQLGTDNTLAGVSASDAATAMGVLAKGGFDVQQSMDGVRGTLQLATAAQISAAQAAEIQADALHTFQLGAGEAGNVADYLANVANASTADISDLAVGLAQGGAVANGFGLSIQDTISALGMFANFGIKGSDAGTLMKTSMQSITDQGAPAQGAILELGLQLYDTQGKFVGYSSMMEQVAAASQRMSEQQFQAATNVLFGSDAMRGSMVAANGGTKAFKEMYDAVGQSGGAARMAAAQMQGIPGVIETVSNTAEGAKLALYDMLTPAISSGGGGLTHLLEGLTETVNGIRTGGGGEAVEQIREGFEDIRDAAVDLAPAAGQAVKALSTGVGTVAIGAWRALGAAVQIVEPPLRIVADLLGSNQGMTTGLVAVLAALYLKSKLTVPVLNAGAKATDAWAKAFGGWKTAATGARGEFDQQRGSLTQIRDAYKAAGESGERFGRSTVLAKGAMSGMRSAAGGLVGALGGPWMLAITGATIAVGYLMQKHADAAEAARKHRDEEVALQQTLDAETGAVTEETRKKITDAFNNRGDDGKGVSTADRAQSFGLDPNQLLAAATGDEAVYAALRQKAAEAAAAGIASGGNKTRMQMQDAESAGVSPEEMTKALLHEGDAWDVVNRKITEWTTAQQAANPDFANTMKNGLQSVVDTMPDVNESMISMVQAVNDQARASNSGAEAQRQYNATLNGTWEATEEGTARFAALGAQILSVPSQKVIQTTAITDAAKKTLEDLGYKVERLPGGTVKVTATTDEAQSRLAELVRKVEATEAVVPVRFTTAAGQEQLQVPLAPGSSGAVAGGRERRGLWTPPGGATGGRVNNIIKGPGSGTSDSILAQTNSGQFLRVANGESINTEASTRANWDMINAGNKGQDLGKWFKSIPRYEKGGVVGLDGAVSAMSGAPYVRGGFDPSGADCSGAMSFLVNNALGRPNSSRMATGNAADWLAEAGAIDGDGPAGSLRFGWKNGGAGGGHMAGTLPDGRNVEQGGSVGPFTVGGGVGADDEQFTNHAYIPAEALYAEGDAMGSPSGGGGFGGSGGGSGGGGGGGSTSAASAKRIREAEDHLSDTQDSLDTAKAKLAELKPDAKASTREAAEKRVAKAEREHTQATEDLTAAKQKATDDGADGGDGSKGPDTKSFGSDLAKGALEAIGLDGDVFSDPTQWGIFKTGVGIANYAAKVAKGWGKGTGDGGGEGGPLGSDGGAAAPGADGGGFGALVNGMGEGAGISGLGDTLAAAIPQPGQPIQNSQTGGGVVNDNSVTFQGNVGLDKNVIVGAMDAKRNERKQTAASGIPKGPGNP